MDDNDTPDLSAVLLVLDEKKMTRAGWKRRWCVLQGSALRAYDEATNVEKWARRLGNRTTGAWTRVGRACERESELR